MLIGLLWSNCCSHDTFHQDQVSVLVCGGVCGGVRVSVRLRTGAGAYRCECVCAKSVGVCASVWTRDWDRAWLGRGLGGITGRGEVGLVWGGTCFLQRLSYSNFF